MAQVKDNKTGEWCENGNEKVTLQSDAGVAKRRIFSCISGRMYSEEKCSTAGTGKSAAPAVEVTSIAVCYCAPKMLVNFSSIEPEFSLM